MTSWRSFVRYALPEQATKAIQNMSGFKIENKVRAIRVILASIPRGVTVV